MLEEERPAIREAILSKYVSTCFHFLSLVKDDVKAKNKLVRIIESNRMKLLVRKTVALKVKVALIISFISFDLVIWLNKR